MFSWSVLGAKSSQSSYSESRYGFSALGEVAYRLAYYDFCLSAL